MGPKRSLICLAVLSMRSGLVKSPERYSTLAPAAARLERLRLSSRLDRISRALFYRSLGEEVRPERRWRASFISRSPSSSESQSGSGGERGVRPSMTSLGR